MMQAAQLKLHGTSASRPALQRKLSILGPRSCLTGQQAGSQPQHPADSQLAWMMILRGTPSG